MRTLAACLLFVSGLSVLKAQTPSRATLAALQQELHGKQLVLRSFSADGNTDFHYENGELRCNGASLHAFAVFVPAQVKAKDEKLTISGARTLIVRNAVNGVLTLLPDYVPATLSVDLTGVSADEVVPKLPAAIFFPASQSAIAALPSSVASIFPLHYDVKTRALAPVHSSDHAAAPPGGADSPARNPALMKAPILIRNASPVYPINFLASHEVLRYTLLTFVNESGRTEDVWLTSAALTGYEEFGAKSVLQYIFKPATYDGKPVQVEVYIEENIGAMN